MKTSNSTPSAARAEGTACIGDRQRARPAAMWYRAWQFWHAITPHRLSAADRAIILSTLPPSGTGLFFSMSVSDQHHSLLLYQALRTAGCTDSDMLAAALLHDSGKGAGRVPLWVRPLVVLARAFWPAALSWLARNDAFWWRRPFYFAWHHAGIGADLAAAAGLSERTVLLIRTHHEPDGPAAGLHALDDAL